MQHYERQGYFFNEEIINYYIDLGKKDCSIAKKFRVLINFTIKKELTISKSELFTFYKLFSNETILIIVFWLFIWYILNL